MENSTPKERKKRRRREKETNLDDVNVNVSVEIVNRNGVVVDLAAVVEEERENEGGPYGEELRRRATGMEREEELLGMLAGMEGEWCSRRKKRRVVKACLLGDALPVGWKVIVALRRKGGRFFPYCRRYVSPTGEQLSSCKEVSSYLQSYFGINDASILRDARGELQQVHRIEVCNEMCVNSEEGNSLLNVPGSTVPNTCAAIERGKDVSDLEIDNLSEVQVCDIYECHTCNVSFGEKDRYLQHLLSFHKRTTRRYQLGSSVGGVTIKDGKHKCQLCCQGKCCYLGHGGHHVKNFARPSEDALPVQADGGKLSCMDWLPNTTGISPMDALVEVAQTSIHEIRTCVLEKEPPGVGNGDKPSNLKNFTHKNTGFMSENNSHSCPSELEMVKGSGEVKTSSEELNSCDKVSRTSSACLNKTEVEKVDGEDKTSLVELIPTCDGVHDISMTDGDINDSGACPTELKTGKGSNQDESSSKELSSCFKVLEISRTDRSGVDTTVKELEMEKDAGHGIFFPEELNPLDNVDNINAETKKQALTCNGVESDKSSNFAPMTLSATESGLHSVKACGGGSAAAKNEGSSVECKGMLNIPYLFCNATPFDLHGAEEKIKSDYVDKLDPKGAQEFDDSKLADVPGETENHASSYADPRKAIDSSTPFDGTLEKAEQDMRGGCDQNLESEIGPEYLELDVIEPQMYSTMNEGNFISLSEVSMDVENTRVGVGPDSSIGSQSEFQLGMAGGGLTTISCVWCGIEFCHELVDVLQPDSVGFMCPTCRAKISKQFNELGSNFSNFHYC